MEKQHKSPPFEQAVRNRSSPPHFSGRAQALWAKSGDESGSLSLPQHLLDSAGAAAAVYDTWVAKSLKKRLADDLELTEQ